ncbi:MAG: PH domain-containing protein [Ruminococcus sp.]|nr:PH domain-containing protein [Ruminococcus sp.]
MISEINGIRNYKASRRAMTALYMITGSLACIGVLFLMIDLFTETKLILVKLIVRITVYGLILGVILPKFFKSNHISISATDIVCVRGVLTNRTVYMPMDAVKSVSMVISPMGARTGLNFIVLNALGARLIVPFLDKEDCIDIYSFVNELIMKR